jgi:hypothetical protein
VRHGLCRESSTFHEAHQYIAGLEKHSEHQAPAALRIPIAACVADDLVGEVAETLAGREGSAGLAVERGHGVGMLTHLPFGLFTSRIRPHAAEDKPMPMVEKLPQRVGLDRGAKGTIGSLGADAMAQTGAKRTAPCYPSPDEINALPETFRRYIHDLETRCDKSGDVQTIALLREDRDALQKRVEELEAQVSRLRAPSHL